MRPLAVAICALLTGLTLIHPLSASNPWANLRRPLHLPLLAPDSACPRSGINRHVDWKRTHMFGGPGIGRGPVYPGLGGRASLYALPDAQFGGPWAGGKVFWYIAPRYRGPVLIRGHRLDGPENLSFNGRKDPLPELRIKRGETVRWSGQPAGSRGIPSGVRVIANGCYGVQIDGTTFSRIVVFSAEIA